MTTIEAWKRVAVKQRVGLGPLATAREDEFAAVVAAASLVIPDGDALTEREVNERLVAWLAGAGSMLATDHVELRRWLVDLRLVERDGYGRAYRRAVPPATFAPAVAALASIDAAEVASAARAEHERVRAVRRAKHEARHAGTR